MDTNALTQITVGLGERTYPIYFGEDIFACLPQLAKNSRLGKRAVLISNVTVAPLYADLLKGELSSQGFEVDSYILPDGEEYKNLTSISQVIDYLVDSRAERKTWLIALGGGVIGDMVGFVSAIYLRGVPFIQVPTTLLSQVDSSVGGKTGVNHPLGKNLIGAFNQPRFVLIDVATLKTLPYREFLSGLAEVLKYGIVLDAELFDYIEINLTCILQRSPEVLLYLSRRCCEIKARIVEADEREGGVRAVLNYGHTLGHAIEALTSYSTYTHGEAVAIGMIAAATLSQHFGECTFEDSSRIKCLIKQCGLPYELPHFSTDEYRQAILKDKKMQDGAVTFVLNKGIGAFQLQPVADIGDILAGCGIGG